MFQDDIRQQLVGWPDRTMVQPEARIPMPEPSPTLNPANDIMANGTPPWANSYYMNLINQDDPNDPIRRLLAPHEEEQSAWGKPDPSDEASVTVARGVQHKYRDTVLLLCSDVCNAYCRYCFRKRLFKDDNAETSLDVSRGIEYVRAHPEVTDVLLTGGDPLMLSTRRLTGIIVSLRSIPHVRTIRIGSKMPAFDPMRILDDEVLLSTLQRNSTLGFPIYLMAHFDHPRELTSQATACINRLSRLGVRCVNQCPIIRGVNDDSDVLGELFFLTTWTGCPQYYVFQCRPTTGNLPYTVPLVRSYTLFEQAFRGKSGLSRTGRFVISHSSGKVEIVGIDAKHVYARYHRAKNEVDEGRFLVFRRDDDAFWLDDLISCN